MPRFEINGPDGRRFEIDGPDGSTLEQAIEYTKQTYYGAQTTPAAPTSAIPTPAPIAPTVAQPKVSAPPPEDEGIFAKNWRYAKDAFASGIESFQSSIKGEVMATDAAIIQGIEKKYGPGAKDAPPDVKEEYSKSVQSYLQAQRAREDLQKQAQIREQTSPIRPATAQLKAAMQPEVAFTDSAVQAWDAIKSDPVGVIADLGVESLPASLYMVASAAVARLGLKTPTAAPIAGGAASMTTEFGNEYAQRIMQGESHDEAWKNASIKSGVIGVFDALSLGSAGKAAGQIVEKLTKKGAALQTAKEVGKETLKQAGYGAAGEAVGSLAVGEIPNPASVMAEAIGEVFGAPLEATASYRAPKKHKEDNLIAALDANLPDNLKTEPTAEATYAGAQPIPGAPSKDVTGRIEPSLSIPSGRKATAAGEPEKVEPTGLGAPSVPTEGAEVREKPAPTPLSQLFAPSDTVNPQQKRTNIHYNTLMTQPGNPVTQSLSALDTAIQKAQDTYGQIEEQLGIPKVSELDQISGTLWPYIRSKLGEVSPPIKALLDYPSVGGSAQRLVAASKDFVAGNKRGSQERVDEAIDQVRGNVFELDQLIQDAVADANKPEVQEQINALNDYVAKQAEELATPTAQPSGAKTTDLIDKWIEEGRIPPPKTKAAPAEAEAPEIAPTAPVALALPEGINDAQFLDAATKLRAGKVMQVKLPILRGLKEAGFVLGDNSLSPQGEEALDRLASAAKPADLRPAEETFKAKPGVNARRMSKLLGPKLYGNPEEMPKVSVKEMVQNAFDAIKPLQEQGKLVEGNIAINVDPSSRIISVLDNGTGMDTKTLGTTFLTIAGTKKEGERDSGGLGIAKMQFLFNNKAIKVVTMRDGVVSVLEGTGAQLEEAMDDPSVAPDIRVFRGKSIPDAYLSLFPDGHGTYAEVVVPESYTDETTGNEAPIEISGYKYEYVVLRNSPLFADIDVTFNGDTVYIGKNFPYNQYTQFVDVKFNWGDARIYVSKTQETQFSDNVSILSNGLWQFDFTLKANKKVVPRKFFIDVSPKKGITPESSSYPFDLNRQRFSPTTEQGFSQIFKYLSVIYSAVDFSSDVDNFGVVQYLEKTPNGEITESEPRLLKPSKQDTGLAAFASKIGGADTVEVKDGRLYVKGREIPEITSEDLKSAEIDLDEFVVPQSEIDPSRIILHDNVSLPNPEIASTKKELIDLRQAYSDDKIKYSDFAAKRLELQDKIERLEKEEAESLVALSRKKFGNKFDEFVYEIGDIFQNLRTLVVRTMGSGYNELLNEGIGISIDVEYRGVSTKIPFSGMFINPAAPETADDIEAAAMGTMGTMIHEFAHFKERNHYDRFAAEMQRINYKLAADEMRGDTTYPNLRKRIVDAYKQYKDVFTYLNGAINESDAKPRGKRFKDAGSFEIRDERRPERMVEPGPTTEGAPAVFRGAEPSDIGAGAERKRTGVPGQIASGSLEDKVLNQALKAGKIAQPVAEKIAQDDLSGALRILATRTTNGFYKDLLEALANLNMPTNIVFNGERDLTRRYIDLKTAKQQTRLFRYVEATYPDVYAKYFQNYDREENLEKVHEGLKILKQPRFKLGPVAAEFEDVSETFDGAMLGLRVPGAYYPAFDTINLSFDNATNDTLIHEALHAATEAILEADPDTLTQSQREAVAEIKRMYKYATEQIPLGLYGLKDVHEFISELFTNKSFRERLKQIPYQGTRVPIFTRLVRAIFKAVGMDNLAGAAMSEATKIFSAVRPRTAFGTAPRFAPKGKRVRGPISTSWRSVEQTHADLTKTLGDAINGRQKWDSMLPQILPAMWDAGTTMFRRGILGFANLRQIDDLTKTKFPQISGAIRIIEQMIADRNRKMNEAKDTLQKWTKAQANNPRQSKLMGRIMLEATIRGVDPDTAKAGTLNKPLQDAWDSLSPEFKEIYREVRNFYSRSINEMINEMKKRALQLPKAERQQVFKNINEKFGPDKLVSPYFPLRRFGKYWFQVGSGNFKEFYEFENPLARELAFRKRQTELAAGNRQQRDLVATMRKGNGISELYSQNLSSTQVLKDAQDLIDNVTSTSVADVKKELKDSLDQLIYILLPQQSVRKMFINRKAIQGASEDMLRVFATTAVHTAYQQSRFKYAEKFVNNLMTARDYVKELPNSDVYNDYIQEVEKRVPTILSNEDTSMGAVVAGKISDATFYWMLSAPFSAILNTLGMAQITMPYIGGRYGYAKTNLFMLRNLGRYFATLPKRTIAPGLQGNIMQTQFPSIVEGGNLSPLFERAARRFIEDNDINISQTNDIMDIGGRPSELYTGRYNTVKRTVAGLFHQSERLNREVTLMTVFELAYDKYLKEPKKDLRGIVQRDNQGDPIPNTPDEAFELAITEAKDIAGLSLGDFTRQMKPRYFTPPLPSVIFKFKQYSVLATYVIARNFYYTLAAPFRKSEIDALRKQMQEDGIDEDVIDQRIAEADMQRREAYKEGRRRLAGILGITYLLGGTQAMPFFSIGLGTLIKMMAPDDDDEFFDWENWFRNYCETELGGYFADLFKKMGMDQEKASKAGRKAGEAVSRGPAAVATGGSLAERVSLDPMNLWFRDARFSTDTRDSVTQTIIANAGPAVGLTVNVAEAIELMEQGQYQRAFEKMAPAIVAKPAASYRLSEEGARTKSGIKLADNFTAWELAMQAAGLQPERLAQAQKAAIEAKTMQEKIKDQRATILNRLWLERNNPEGFNDAIDRALKFSNKYPELKIDGTVIRESFKKRAKNQAEAEVVGAQIDKKLRPRIMPMTEYGKE